MKYKNNKIYIKVNYNTIKLNYNKKLNSKK